MANDRSLVDPQDGYRATGLRPLEHRALAVLRWREGGVLERTRDAIQVTFADPTDGDAELSALLTPEALELRLPTIEWTAGSHGPFLGSRLWRRVPWARIAEGQEGAWLDELAAAYGRHLRKCVRCQQTFLPSRMAGRTCHGCFSGVF